MVNIPHSGQIEGLPQSAVVECIARVDGQGVHPYAVGELPEPAQTIVSGHMERQEAIVEAGLTGNFELAREALRSDPLIQDPSHVSPMFDELIAANKIALENMERQISLIGSKRRIRRKLARLNAASPTPIQIEHSRHYSVEKTRLGQLLSDEKTRRVLEKHLPGIVSHPQVHLAANMTLKRIAPFAREILTKEKLRSIQADFSLINSEEDT